MLDEQLQNPSNKRSPPRGPHARGRAVQVGSACANEIGSISAIFEEEVRATRGHEPFRVGFAHLIDVIYP